MTTYLAIAVQSGTSGNVIVTADGGVLAGDIILQALDITAGHVVTTLYFPVAPRSGSIVQDGSGPTPVHGNITLLTMQRAAS